MKRRTSSARETRDRRSPAAWIFAAGCAVAVLLIVSHPAAAQVTVGEDVKMNLAGDLSAGYNGSYGTQGSGHGFTLGGNASLNGFYYNPQFINFQVEPYYNRSQANSAFQSITDSSGVIASASLFSGSHFPGTVSFQKTYDSTGQFGVPGTTGLTTSGSQQALTLNWSALIPDWPTLQVLFIANGGNVSIPGAKGESHTNSKTIGLNSSYRVRGFQLSGHYGHGWNHSESPGFLVGEEGTDSGGGSNYFGGSVGHAIPKGYWSLQATHSNFESDSRNPAFADSSSGSNTALNTSASFHLMPRLGLGVDADYQTNALGALEQQIVEAGGSNPFRYAQDGHSYGVHATAQYSFSHWIYATGSFSHRELTFLGQHNSYTQYGGGISTNFSKTLLRGLTFFVGANDTASKEGNDGAGMFANVNYDRRFSGWDVSSSFNYSQSVQTLFGIYTTSSYGY